MTSIYLFYGLTSKARKQNLFIWLLGLWHTWIFVYLQQSGDLEVSWFDGGGHVLMRRSGGRQRTGRGYTTRVGSGESKELHEFTWEKRKNSMLCLGRAAHVCWTLLRLTKGSFRTFSLSFFAVRRAFSPTLESCMGKASKIVFEALAIFLVFLAW